MPSSSGRPLRPVRVASLSAVFDQKPGGVIYVRSLQPLRDYSDRVTDRLELWATHAPERIFLAQRAPDGNWRTITYSEALVRVRNIASGLLAEGLSTDRPLMILSGNSIEHGLLALAAMHVGIPYAPVAPAYSLAVREHVALSHLWQNRKPAMVFVDDGHEFSRSLNAVLESKTKVVYGSSPPPGISAIPLMQFETTEPSSAMEEAN